MATRPYGRIAFDPTIGFSGIHCGEIMDLRPQIEKFARRFAEVESALSDPKAFDNPQRAQDLSREYARLKELVASGRAYLKVVADLQENRALLKSEKEES